MRDGAGSIWWTAVRPRRPWTATGAGKRSLVSFRHPYTVYRRRGEAWRLPGQIEHGELPEATKEAFHELAFRHLEAYSADGDVVTSELVLPATGAPLRTCESPRHQQQELRRLGATSSTIRCWPRRFSTASCITRRRSTSKARAIGCAKRRKPAYWVGGRKRPRRTPRRQHEQPTALWKCRSCGPWTSRTARCPHFHKRFILDDWTR